MHHAEKANFSDVKRFPGAASGVFRRRFPEVVRKSRTGSIGPVLWYNICVSEDDALKRRIES